jgi:hypothetical protein
MVWKIEKFEDIRKLHHGYAVLHLVRQAPVCAPCARAAFRDGDIVTAGSFDEGEPVECDCGNVVESTYGPV